MKYIPSNARLAAASMKLFFSKIPFKSLHRWFLHPFIHALCPPKLRQAFGSPQPSKILIQVTELLLIHTHSFLVRHLVTPRGKKQSSEQLWAMKIIKRQRWGDVCSSQIMIIFRRPTMMGAALRNWAPKSWYTHWWKLWKREIRNVCNDVFSCPVNNMNSESIPMTCTFVIHDLSEDGKKWEVSFCR